jgi:hypothetical protein
VLPQANIINPKLYENKTYLVDTHPDSTERLASAQAASVAAGSSLLTTPLPPGTSPGEAVVGVAVGMIIGMQIVKSFEDSKAQAEANQRTAPIEQYFPRHAVVDMMSTYIMDAANAQTNIDSVHLSMADPKFETVRTLFAEPELHFNVDLSRLEIKLNAGIKDLASQKMLYQNSFEYWSKPIGSTNQCEENCTIWTRDDGKMLTFYLKEGCEEIISMLLYDLETLASQGQITSSPQMTHHIISERGTVFLRSSLVREAEDRVWLKDLRGNLRSIYGRLEHPDGFEKASLEGS